MLKIITPITILFSLLLLVVVHLLCPLRGPQSETDTWTYLERYAEGLPAPFSQVLQSNCENGTENLPAQERSLLSTCTTAHPIFIREKRGVVSIIFNTAASIWKWLHHTPPLTPLTLSLQKGWSGALSCEAAQTDSINALKFKHVSAVCRTALGTNRLLLLWTERPSEILIRQTRRVSENSEMPTLLAFPQYWTCLFWGPCSYFN